MAFHDLPPTALVKWWQKVVPYVVDLGGEHHQGISLLSVYGLWRSEVLATCFVMSIFGLELLCLPKERQVLPR
jgi:hypothetical protein